jgi:FtsH-binding integral membrane protein
VSSKKRRKRRPRNAPPAKPPADAAAQAAPAKRSAGARRVRGSLDERPPAPWGNVPLVEIAVLAGIALLIAGFVVHGSKGAAMIAAGVVLCSIAGLELSVREHFAGYRSHTLVLSGGVGVAVLAGLAFGVRSLWLPIALMIAVAAFGATAIMLTRVFRRRSGRSFKLR